ncbi:ATP-binding protein [Streptomyces mangrovisoli]|uniref:ATP-binding protein n=1 Tax=Streptomyces mangrovisoli TaxID=1428628 RepID=A0A1J4P141_9ACTN|nr:ATP-binding protein [Streptomyces mangrovisoli]OIJ68479.1 ATP-binding protein [Streptomyces mangrovisoli]
MTSLRLPAKACAASHPAYSQILPCEPSAAQRGRELVREVLSVWGLSRLADPATLITTELIANASGHTRCSEVRLVLDRPSPSLLRIAVVDGEPSSLPMLSQASVSDESGRGLLLINAVTDRWGYDLTGPSTDPWGKEVWAELRTEDAR